MDLFGNKRNMEGIVLPFFQIKIISINSYRGERHINYLAKNPNEQKGRKKSSFININ